MRTWVLVPLALAATADAFAPTSSFTPGSCRNVKMCKAAAAAPRAARLLLSSPLKMQQTEEISEEEYEELLRAAGRLPPKSAAASKPAGGGGLFGGMFGGANAAPAVAAPAAKISSPAKSDWQELFSDEYKAPYWWNEKTGETTWDKPAALSAPPPKAAPAPPAKKAGGLISPVTAAAAKPKPAVQAKPRQQAASMYDDEDYLAEKPIVSKQERDAILKSAREPTKGESATASAAPVAAAAAPAATRQASGGFFGGLFGGNKQQAASVAQPAILEGKEEILEAELRELMAAAGKETIKGFDVKVPPGRQAGYKQIKTVKQVDPNAVSMAPPPTNTGITDLGGVKVTTIKKGDGKTYPQALTSGRTLLQKGDTLTMHYVGKLRETKQVFDSSLKRNQPFEFVIGAGMVIPGWDQGIMQMSLGEKAQLVIQSDFGYGAAGQGPIPPNADLVFDVDLLAINGIKASGRYAGGN